MDLLNVDSDRFHALFLSVVDFFSLLLGISDPPRHISLDFSKELINDLKIFSQYLDLLLLHEAFDLVGLFLI